MECFGESDSSDDETAGRSGEPSTAAVAKRDASCGVCAFHPHTEASLLVHVRNRLQGAPTTETRRAADVLEAVDEFCTSRHWMMHVGPEKGGILVDSLREAMQGKVAHQSPSSSPAASPIPFVAVELGSYCGYAAILMGRAFHKFREATPAALECRLFTTEIDPTCADIASEMIRLGGVDDVVSLLRISYDGRDTDVASVVEGALRETTDRRRTIDFLFVDHDKDDYKADLCKLESAGLIRRGTRVVADNVLFAGIAEYVAYVQQREKEGIVSTRTVPCHVEYCDDDRPGGMQQYKDGIGK